MMRKNIGEKMKEMFIATKYWLRTIKLLFEVNWFYMICIIVFAILQGILPVATLLITQELINTILVSIGKSFDPVLFWFVLLAIVSLVLVLVQIIQGYLQSVLQILIVYKLNVKLMKKSSELSLTDFENPEIYDKLQRAQGEVGTRPFQVFTTLLSIITGIITLLSSAVVLITWKWWVFLLLIITPIISTYYSLKIGKWEFDIQVQRTPKFRKSWYYSFLLTKDINYKEIKAFNLGEYIVNRYKKIYDDFIVMDKKIARRKAVVGLIFSCLEEIIGLFITLFIIFVTFTGEILIGNLMGYMKAVGLCVTSFKGVFNSIASLLQNNLYIKQFFEFLDLETDMSVGKQDDYIELGDIKKIEFQNVSFKYPGTQKYALKNVSFSIKKGQIIGIVGENGSGKSTLTKLLLRLYRVEEGTILINDQDINKYSEEDVRKRMSVVFQDYVKYELTVQDNIGLGNVKSLQNKERILQSAEKSGAKSMIEQFPEGINTQLGSWFAESQQLSGGQWQKIAVARSFFKPADIYILDEPSAVLDPISEKHIFDKFFNVVEDKIGIFTSHRFSTIKIANEILVFDKGSLVEKGSHNQLVEQNGYYSKLYGIQASPFNEENKKSYQMN
ncbi:hypothetical protein COM73_27235 [Bacillus thuringiensis]|nr:hypothetical protein COM73_27235 [Bacillus thuringiensis]